MSASQTILFVDDDPTTRKIYEAKAKLSGYQYLMAANPSEAVKLLKQVEVGVIVTDLMMPVYDGVDLIKAVREHPKTKVLPIIVLTYGGNLERVDTASHVGASEIHDKKDCTPDKLFARIAFWLAKTAQAKPVAT